MTCIVAITDGEVVTMGADSAGTYGYSLCTRKDPKIYRVKEFLIGFTSSFRMGQILGYNLNPPIHPDSKGIVEYMCTDFIAEIRFTLKYYGYATVNNNAESGGTFLVGYKGKIFKIDSDFQVGESIYQFDATGCGQDIALGSLFSTQYMIVQDRITLALQAAEKFSAGVRAPFYTLEI